MVHTVQHAGPSTEAMLPFSPQSPRSALPALPSHVQAIHDFDPTLLASTSNGNPNMYLSFSAGDILKVQVRDQTGWWDGEVASAPQPGDGDGRKGPRRGWFPSNYVRDMGWEALPHRKNNSNASGASSARRSPSDMNHSISSVHTRQTSSALSQQTRASTPNSASPTHSHFGQRVRQASSPLPQSPNGMSLSPSLQALLHPIVQALSLLETTIHANRKTHIQPSTACVISAIRAALQQTDCLSKESPVLARHNVLSKERKMVLVELSKLVACARTASGVGDDGTTIERTEEEDDREMEALARAARGVFGGVKRFLQLAGNCGVEAIPLPDEDGDSSNGLATPTAASLRPGGLRVRTTSSGNTRIQETFKKKAASIGDLRATKRRQSSPPPPMPGTAALDVERAAQTSRSRSPSITTPISATFTATSGSGPPSPVSIKSGRGRRIQGSIDSSFSHHTTASSDGGHGQETSFESQDVTPVPTPPAAIIDKRLGSSPLDFTERVGSAEDALLSIIAAFIGHIHSHHIGSHPSSHATLVDMTRQTIDAVRDLLTIVEEIGHNIRLRSIRPRDLDSLRVAKDQLYDVASRLVESAEAVANALPDSGDEGYDKDKNQLLQSATGTLRAGTECVRLVRLCTPELSALLSTPKQGINAARHHTPRPNQEAALIKRDYPVGQRGEHTLSGLHRKATSLSYLSKRYQQDGGMVHGPVEEGEQAQLEDDDDEEIVADTSREEDVTVKPMAIGSPSEPSHLTREPTVRPSLVHMHTAPLGIPPAAKSAGLQRTHSEGPTLVPRSRSSSLSSPAPPRLQRRSPSRSADLDQHTGEYDIPIRPKPQQATISSAPAYRTSVMTAFSQSSVSTRASGSTALTSTRSSGGSFSHTSRPQTPHLQDSPQLGSFKVDFSPDLSLPKLSQLKIDTGRDVTVPRPQPHSAVVPRPPAIRTVTSPVQAQPDMRFWVSAHDYDPREITFNSDGNMVGASLAVLVEKMTPHDGPVDLTFWSSFFYTFRLHTSPPNLLEALIRRYDITPPSNVMMTEREVEVWVERKVVPVRLRVYNLLKSWLDTFWKSEADDVVLDTLKAFVTTTIQRTLPAMAPRLQESIRKRASGPPSAGLDRPPSSASSYGERKNHSRTMSSDKLSLRSHLSVLSPTVSTPSPSPTGLNPMSQLPPTPVISKSLHTLLQKPNVELSRIPLTEFDTLELARQMTIMESKMFNQVAPEDLLLTGRRKVDGLKALSETSNQITGWVADSILAEMDIKRRTALLKFYIKLADKCLSLHNFSSMWAILAGLNSSTIMRLKKTWDALSSKSTKYRLMMDRLRAVIEHTKNHAAYRARLREVTGPCLPFLGLILTDITFTFDGNPDTRQSTLAPDLSLVNHDKYAKLGKIAVEFKRYQEPFNFHALEAVQAYLKRVLAERGSSSIDALYRKSLLLEPRQGQERVSTFIERPGWLGGRI